MTKFNKSILEKMGTKHSTRIEKAVVREGILKGEFEKAESMILPVGRIGVIFIQIITLTFDEALDSDNTFCNITVCNLDYISLDSGNKRVNLYFRK